jgi:hypothetical protein
MEDKKDLIKHFWNEKLAEDYVWMYMYNWFDPRFGNRWKKHFLKRLVRTEYNVRSAYDLKE